MTFLNVLLAIFLLTLINLKSIMTLNCPQLCVCLNSTTIDCSNKNLTSIPNGLPNDTKILLLKNNRIDSIRSLVLPNLTKVDLSGNKINCGCDLIWTKNASFSIIATCQSPTWVKGRSLADLTTEDMCKTCKINSSTLGNIRFLPQQSGYQENDTVLFTCPLGYLMRGPASLTCLANGTWNSTALPYCQEILSTTPVVAKTIVQSTVQISATTSPQRKNTTTARKTIPTTVEPQTSTNKPNITEAAENPKTTKDKVVLPTRLPNVNSTPVPTGRKNETEPLNLTTLVEVSNSKQLPPETLRNLITSLERHVVERNFSDTVAVKNILLISSNVLKEDNHKTWSTVNKNFPGGEKLLNVVNEAMKLYARRMLKSMKNHSQHIFFNNTNLVAEIQVVIAKDMANKEIQFPVSKSPEDDYVQISGSSFKKAGKEKVAVIGMKSAQLGKLLPQRSMIDGFDSFNTGSGLLSASVLSLQQEFSSSVKIVFKNKIFLGDDEELTKCAFWKNENTEKNANSETSGSTKSGWSDKGCQVMLRNRSTTVCHCDHMTDFAVLTQSIVVIPKPTVLMYVAGLCLLIGATIACIRDIFVWRKTRHERLSVLIHECLAFILSAVVFLLGLFFDYNQVMCMIFSALLQCFILAVFCWILTEFLQLYLCTRFGWNRSSSRFKYFAIIGWVIPLVLVGITLAITRQNDYGSEQWCWFSNSHIVLLIYVCPIVLCILCSILFILKIGCFKSDATDDSEKKDISVVMALSAFLVPLVLCAFTTAALSADRPEEKVFQYLFILFCVALAIYIVIYHCWLDREIMKLSVRKNVERPRPKRDYYSTNETVMYSEDTSEGKKFSLIFPSRKSPEKKPKKDERKPAKRSDSSSPFDYNSTVPLYPSLNDSSLKSFKSQVSTQQHTFDSPPNTLTAITISRPNSQCIELTSLSDLDRRPDGAEQTDASGERGEFYGARHSNPFDKERQRTSGCSTDCTNATTFGKEKLVQKPSDAPSNDGESKNRISGASSAGLSRTSRSSVSGASLTAAAAAEENADDDTFETQPFIPLESDHGPEIRSDPPAKIPKRRKRGSRRRLDDEFHDDDKHEPKIKTRQGSSSLPSTESSVKLKQYTSF